MYSAPRARCSRSYQTLSRRAPRGAARPDANASDLGFTGGLKLSEGIIHLGSRDYWSSSGRWLQPDDVDLRRYTYAAGDPLNRVDPGGHQSCDVSCVSTTANPNPDNPGDYLPVPPFDGFPFEFGGIIQVSPAMPSAPASVQAPVPSGPVASYTSLNPGAAMMSVSLVHPGVGTNEVRAGLSLAARTPTLRSFNAAVLAASTGEAQQAAVREGFQSFVEDVPGNALVTRRFMRLYFAGAVEDFGVSQADLPALRALAEATDAVTTANYRLGQGLGGLNLFAQAMLGGLEGNPLSTREAMATPGVAASVRYTAADVGPLEQSVARTFRGGSYTAVTTSEPVTLYRGYGGSAGPLGPFWTRTPPAGPLQHQLDAAIVPSWGNTLSGFSRIRVPAGTTIFEGFAAPQPTGVGSLLGGGSQVFIPRVDPAWLVP